MKPGLREPVAVTQPQVVSADTSASRPLAADWSRSIEERSFWLYWISDHFGLTAEFQIATIYKDSDYRQGLES